MELKEYLKIINGLAKMYKIKKPYLVGGIPRDIYLKIPNIKTTDVDITTNSNDSLRLGILLADKINEIFEVSEDGHVTVFANRFDFDFSSNFISQRVSDHFRGEKQDLLEVYSRDFTINTLHQDLETGQIIDPTGMGFNDVSNKIIRTPVPAEITLQDDPRRIYRAINLAVRYGFNIDDEIISFSRKNKELFSSKNIKDKYAVVKINKALQENADKTIELLKELGLFGMMPLSGRFKDTIIAKKYLAEYLESNSLDSKFSKAQQNISHLKKAEVSQGAISIPNDPRKFTYDATKNVFKDQAGGSIFPGSILFKKLIDSGVGGEIEAARSKARPQALTTGVAVGGSPAARMGGSPGAAVGGSPAARMGGSPGAAVGGAVAGGAAAGGAKIDAISSGLVRFNPKTDISNLKPQAVAFINELGRVARLRGAGVPYINSGYRSPGKQAVVVIGNWKRNGGYNGGRKYLGWLYKDNGLAIDQIIRQYKIGTAEEDLKGCTEVVTQYIIKNPISKHQSGLAIDLNHKTPGIDNILKEIEENGKKGGTVKIRLLDERGTANPHWHVTVLA